MKQNNTTHDMKRNMTQVMTNDMKKHDMRIYGVTEIRRYGEGSETRQKGDPQFAYGKPVVSLRETRSLLTVRSSSARLLPEGRKNQGFAPSMLRPLFRRLRHLTRLAALFVLLMSVSGVKAADYVFMYNNYILGSSTTPTTTFVPNASIYTGTSGGTFRNGEGYYLKYSGVVGTTSDYNFSITTNGYVRLTDYTNYYLRMNNPNSNNRSWTVSNSTNYRAVAYTVTTTQNSLIDHTTPPTISIASVSGNTINFNKTGVGEYYIPANSYTIYTFNGTTHNCIGNTDYGADEPQNDAIRVYASTLSPTYTWSLTANGGGVASINSSTGVLTLSGAPTADITVHLEASNIGDLEDTKTADFTLTREAVAQNVSVETTLTTPTIDPSSAVTLNYEDSQTFRGSATATKTTTTTKEYVKLTHGNTTYYYCDGALSQNTSGFTSSTSVPQEVTYSWSLTGAGATGGDLTPTSGTGNSITITHANASGENRASTLTLTASTPNNTTGQSGNLTKTASVTITATQTLPTAITADVASITICQGSTGTINYTLSPAGAYNRVTASSDYPEIASYSGDAATNGVMTIRTGTEPGTATLTLQALDDNNPSNTIVTTTVTVTTQERVIAPTISFDNTTGELTIESETTGATIYYTTDGTIATTASTSHVTPVVLNNITSTTPINALADKTGLCSSGEVVTKTIEKLPTPTLSTGSDGKTTMTCATAGATIRYTTDGTNPTATTGTIYSSPVTLPSGSSVKAIAVMDDHINSDIATLTTQAPAATPSISISDTGSVTITSATSGATIRYTTDGSDPTPTTGTVFNSAFTVSNGVTVKAIATATDYLPSEVASRRYMVESGVSGTTVTLNDAEDHSWSYYSDPDCPIRSLSPADVMITYYGDGIVMKGNDDYTSSTTSSSYVVPGNENYVGGAKVNVGGENENTFIYYKTLERGDATQTAWTFSSGSQSSAASRCPYTPIPNPFQVRPTYGNRTVNGNTTDADQFTGWRGFQCWRLKKVSGGAIYSIASGGSALSTGAVINAETEIYFAPNSEYGMEVEFEAVWARAYLKKGNNSGANNIPSYNVGVERNFMTLTAGENYRFNGTSGRRITNVGYPVTISCYYPSGEAPENTNSTVGGNNDNITLGADTKFENLKFNSALASYTLSANGHNLTIGRGVSGYNGGVCASAIQGITSNSGTTLDYKLRVESGVYSNLYFLSYKTNIQYVSDLFTLEGTDNHVNVVLGCDYDRAKNDNEKFKVQGHCVNSSGVDYSSQDPTKMFLDVNIKSGSLHTNTTDASSTINGGLPYCVYLGENYGAYLHGKRRLTVEGGSMFGIAGGADVSNNNDATNVFIRIKGGTMRGSVFGAAAQLAASGDRRFVVTGGTINGWLAGGCNGVGDAADYGKTDGTSYIYFGGKAKLQHNTTYDRSIGSSKGGNLYGAGSGLEGATNETIGQINSSNIIIADESQISRNVFGGGNFGYVKSGTNNASNIYVLGGTIKGAVYGGSNQQQGQTVNITMKDGTVEGGIYGGSNITGTIYNDVTMHIDGGQVGTSSADAVIHGGGMGNATRVLGSVNLTLGASTTATDSVTVYGDVYGGSAQGKTNGNTSLTSGAVTNVTLNKGDIHGSLYGGGLGNASYEADVYGPVTVVVNGGSVTKDGEAGVFGCNNVKGTPKSTVTVTVTGTNDKGVDNVFGGGNQADYTPPSGQPNYPTVTMTGGLVNNSVFGGGNKADIKGNANVSISGGTVINRVFGGGNLGSVGTFSTTTSVTGHSSHTGCIGWPASTDSWSVGGKCTVTVSGGKVGKDNMTMPQDFGYVFGASRGETIDPAIDADIDFRAYVKETEVTISGTAFILGGVYGGSENGHVRGNTWVKIQGGQIGCGVGKTAAYTAEQWSAAETAVKTGDASGINSAAADMPECASWRYQNPYLPYDMNNATEGGATTGSDGHTFYGNVFGGGSGYFPYKKQNNSGYEWNMKAGLVEGNTKVEITGGHILTSVYGGNELTNVTGDSCVVIMTGGTLGVPRTLAESMAHPVTCYLFGAGKGDQRTYFAESTNVNNTRVYVGGTAMIYGSIFGGGEDGHAKGSAKIDVTGGHIGTWGTSYVDGNIFGAGRGFAGESLTSGVVQGNVTINISGGTMLGSVYGGGRLASVGTYLVATNDVNYGKLMGSTGDTTHGNITINISGGTIGNTFEYIVPSGNWDQAWKNSNNITLTEFGSTDSDENRLMHTKGGNVFGGSMGRLYQLNGVTPISNWPDLGKVRKTSITITGGTIKSNVYGGGELGTVAEGTTINITGGTIGTGVGDVGGNPSYTYGSVFGGGYGSEDNINGSLNDTRSTVNSRDHAGLVTGNTDVNISGSSTRIWASVYGGGELAKVNGSTDINIAAGKIGKEVVWHTGDTGMPDWANDNYVRYGGYRMGNVFGGGKGSLEYPAAGLVTGNATILISGGDVYHNVYGGGALGSVGLYTYDANTGNTTCANGTGTTTVTITGGQIGINGYDNGMVNGSSRGGEGDPHGSNLDRVAWVNNSIVKIGTDGQGTTFDNPVIKGSIYGGGENGHNYGNTEVNIYSGTVGHTGAINSTYEHGNVYGAGCGTDTYELNDKEYYNPMAGIVHGTGTVNVKGGHVLRSIYGGGSMGITYGKATVNITGGRIGSAYGGPKGKEGAKIYEENDLFAYCGHDAEVNIDYATTPASDDGSTTQLVTGSVYGGGEAGSVVGSVVVNMKKGLVLGDVYGGGSLADTNIGNATNYGQLSESVPSTSTNTTTVNLTGGIVEGNVFGGGLGRKYKAAVAAQPAQPAQGNEGDPDYVPAVPAVEAQDEVTANPAYVYGDVTVKLNETIATDNCVVRGVVHGANNYNGSPKGDVTVHIYKTVDDGVNVKAANKNNTTYNLKAVYGGGNEAAFIPYAASGTTTTKKAKVIIDGCSLTSIKDVYGGGNAASVPASEVTVNSCYEIGTVFGGGNGLDDLEDGSENPGAHVGYMPDGTTPYGLGEAKVNALGGRIHKVYGGSNTKGNVRTESVAFVDGSNDDCKLELDEVYGGGNEAFMDGNSSVKLGCIDYLKTLYGGANDADVGGDIELTVTSGRFDQVFGGNNHGGEINGTITVNIEETGCHPIVIGELYGGGNLAAYSAPWKNNSDHSLGRKDGPTLNVKSFTSIGRIFGGGLGASAIVTGSPEVNISVALGDHNNGSVTAGSYDYDILDETNNPDGHYDTNGNFNGWTPTGMTIAAPTHAKGQMGAIHTIFGGGNAAKVVGDTHVNIGTEDYISISSVTAGVTDVSGYYTRSGEGTQASPYVYSAFDPKAKEGVTYCSKSGDTYTVESVTVGTTDVSSYYIRTGAGTDQSPYVYTAVKSAEEGTTYYVPVLGVDIRGNIFGGGNQAEVEGDTTVQVGK